MRDELLSDITASWRPDPEWARTYASVHCPADSRISADVRRELPSAPTVVRLPMAVGCLLTTADRLSDEVLAELAEELQGPRMDDLMAAVARGLEVAPVGAQHQGLQLGGRLFRGDPGLALLRSLLQSARAASLPEKLAWCASCPVSRTRVPSCEQLLLRAQGHLQHVGHAPPAPGHPARASDEDGDLEADPPARDRRLLLVPGGAAALAPPRRGEKAMRTVRAVPTLVRATQPSHPPSALRRRELTVSRMCTARATAARRTTAGAT